MASQQLKLQQPYLLLPFCVWPHSPEPSLTPDVLLEGEPFQEPIHPRKATAFWWTHATPIHQYSLKAGTMAVPIRWITATTEAVFNFQPHFSDNFIDFGGRKGRQCSRSQSLYNKMLIMLLKTDLISCLLAIKSGCSLPYISASNVVKSSSPDNFSALNHRKMNVCITTQ